MSGIDFLNLIVFEVEFLKFVLKVFKLWFVSSKYLQFIFRLLSPEPRVCGKALKELGHTVLGTLDGTCQQEDNLDNLLIFGNPVVKWLLLILRDVLLEPELHLLG